MKGGGPRDFSPGAAGPVLAAVKSPVRTAQKGRQLACGDDPDLFFSSNAADVAKAKAICMGCPSRRGCLTYAFESREEFGVWGGVDMERTPQRVAS